MFPDQKKVAGIVVCVCVCVYVYMYVYVYVCLHDRSCGISDIS